MDAASVELGKANKALRFTLRDNTYKAFGELKGCMDEIKDSNQNYPVVLSAVSKVLREVVGTTSIIHASDPGADNKTSWEIEISQEAFERGQLQVNYRTNVALRGRPPAAVSKI